MNLSGAWISILFPPKVINNNYQSNIRNYAAFFRMELWNKMMPRAYPICMVGARCLIWQDFVLENMTETEILLRLVRCIKLVKIWTSSLGYNSCNYGLDTFIYFQCHSYVLNGETTFQIPYAHHPIFQYIFKESKDGKGAFIKPLLPHYKQQYAKLLM